MTDKMKLVEIRERAERTSRLLRGEQERHKNDKPFAFQTDISMMAADSADCIDAMLDTIDSLTAELTDYRALAAEYGIDGKTMLALAKSQIETAKGNAKLTERLKVAVEDINRCMTLLEKIHGHWPCELCSKDGKCVTCHPVWRGEEK